MITGELRLVVDGGFNVAQASIHVVVLEPSIV